MLCMGKNHNTFTGLSCWSLEKNHISVRKAVSNSNWFRITKLSTRTIISAVIVQYLASYFRDPVK